MFSKIFSAIDLFGLPVVLNYCGQEKLKTRFGAICTIFFFGFVAWVIYDSSEEMFRKTKPTTVSSQTISANPREMGLSPDSFPIAIAVQAPQGFQYTSFINESIYTVALYYTSVVTTVNSDFSTNRTIVEKEIPLQRCTREHFGEQVRSFRNFNWNDLYCISLNESNLSIRGGFLSPIYNTLTFAIYECDSNRSSVPCADEDVREQYLEGAWLNLIYSNMVINPNNYTDPDVRYQDTFSKTLTRADMKMSTVYLSHLEVWTDSGFLFEDPSTENFIKMSSSSDNSVVRSIRNTSMPLMSITLEVSRTEYEYTRSYKKIQTVLAEVSSLARTVLMAVMIVMSPYLKLRLRETLMNQLFNIDMEAKEDIHQPMKVKERKELSTNQRRTSKIMKNKTDQVPHLAIDQYLEEATIKTRNTLGNPSTVRKRASILNDNKKLETEILQKKSSFSNEIKKEFYSRKSSTLDKPIKIGSHHRVASWKDQCDKLDKTENKLQKTSMTQNNQASHISLETERKKSDTTKIPTFIEKREIVKIELKILEDQGLENKDNSILFPDMFETERSPELQSPGIKEEENPLSGIAREDDGEEDEGEERIPTLNIIESKIADIVRKAAVVKKPAVVPRGVHVSVWEYLLSFIYQPKGLKKKIKVIETGSKNIIERLDVVTILQKMREIDKIRALLFDNDQLILYHNLPKPEINAGEKVVQDLKSFRSMLTKTDVAESSGTDSDLKAAYKRLKMKKEKTELDERILSIFYHHLE